MNRNDAISMLNLLEDTVNLIEPEKNWCVGNWAENESGGPVHPLHPTAVKWCISGALKKCSRGDDQHPHSDIFAGRDLSLSARKYLSKTAKGMNFVEYGDDTVDGIMHVNDKLGHEQVVAVMIESIGILKSQILL